MKSRWTLFAGLAAITVFSILFAVRLGYFEKKPQVIPEQFLDIERGVQDDSIEYMNILQNGKKIGYVISSLKKSEKGYIAGETVYMELSAMGSVQKTSMSTGANLNPDMTLNSMTFRLSSGMGAFMVKAWMDGGALKVQTGQGEDKQITEFPMQSPPMIDAGLMRMQALKDLEPGEKVVYPIFDPATMGNWDTTIEMLGKDSIKIMGKTVPAKKFSLTFMGQTQTTWISLDGEMLAQEGLMGLRLEKTSRSLALDEESIEEGDDLFALATIPVDTPLMDPKELTFLKIRITGADHVAEQLNQGRQNFRTGF